MMKNIKSRKRLEVQNKVLSFLLCAEDADDLCPQAISLIGEHLGYDRVYIYKYSAAEKVHAHYCRWTKMDLTQAPRMPLKMKFPEELAAD